MDQGLESVADGLPFSPSISTTEGDGGFELLQGQNGTGPQGDVDSPLAIQEGSSATSVTSPATPSTACERQMGGGWKTRVQSMDRVYFLSECLNSDLGEEILSRTVSGSIASTLYHQ